MFHLIEDIFIARFIYDILSFLICIFLLICTLRAKKINKKFSGILLISLLSPLFFNYILFDWTKFPDQSKYLFVAQSVRSFQFDLIKDSHIEILLPGIIYSLFPVPNIYSFTILSMLSRTFFLITLIFTFKEYYKDKAVLFFLLFCPSIILYTSVGLRETFLFSFSILFFFYLKKNKIYYALIFLSLITLIKNEIGFMIILSFGIYYLLFSNINNKFKVLFLASYLLGLILLSDKFLDYINVRYRGFYHEEFLNYPPIYQNYFDVIISLPNSFFKFMLSPLFEITSILRFTQVFDNLLIYIYLFLYSKHCYKLNKLKTSYWLIILFLNLLIYSLLVVNPGSIVRYKAFLFLVILLCLNNFTKKNV